MTNLRYTSANLVRLLASSAAAIASVSIPAETLGYEIDYDLSGFRTTDIVRNSLVFGGELAPSISDRSNVSLFQSQERSDRSVFGRGDLAFRRDTDLASRIAVYRARLEVDGRASTSRNEWTSPEIDGPSSEETLLLHDESERWSTTSVRALSTSAQSYYLGAQPFIGFTYSVNYEFRVEDMESEFTVGTYPPIDIQRSDSDDRSYRHELDSFVAGEAGWGRIYDVSYARQALFILGDLGESGLLQREVDAASVDRLANLIRELEKGRIFDSREKRIHDLEEIVGFLENTGLLRNPGLEGIAIVDDNWTYARNAYRGSGTRLAVQQGYGLFYSDQSSRTRDSDDGTTVEDERRWVDRRHSIRTQIEFARERPLSQRFQLSHSADLGRNTVLDSDTIEYWGSIRTALGYYPNSRDYGSLSLNVSHQDEVAEEPILDRTAYSRRTTGAVIASWQRLLTMRTSLSLNYSFRYADTTAIRAEAARTYTTSSNGFGIRLEHYLM